MNTYEITFTRENGSTGKDRITAANEKQARKDFREIHRHSSATITDVIVAAENVPASKQQERDALDQIRAIVDTLGPDSYLATAFAGCFEDAEENIKNDFACSMKQRLESAAEVAAPRSSRKESQNPEEVPQPHPALCFRGSGCGRRWRPMTAKCVGCGLDWNVSIYQKIPHTGYICPHCESRLRAGETLPNIQASQKARPQRTKGATP